MVHDLTAINGIYLMSISFNQMEENLQILFNALHDGGIVSWHGDKNQLNLKIECQYLAELLDPSFGHFHLQLLQIERLVFVPWMNQEFIPHEYFVSLEDIFQSPLEIKSADIKDDLVVVYCSQGKPGYDYSGGNLYIKCADFKLSDQRNAEISLNELKTISTKYWREFDSSR